MLDLCAVSNGLADREGPVLVAAARRAVAGPARRPPEPAPGRAGLWTHEGGRSNGFFRERGDRRVRRADDREIKCNSRAVGPPGAVPTGFKHAAGLLLSREQGRAQAWAAHGLRSEKKQHGTRFILLNTNMPLFYLDSFPFVTYLSMFTQ